MYSIFSTCSGGTGVLVRSLKESDCSEDTGVPVRSLSESDGRGQYQATKAIIADKTATSSVHFANWTITL